MVWTSFTGVALAGAIQGATAGILRAADSQPRVWRRSRGGPAAARSKRNPLATAAGGRSAFSTEAPWRCDTITTRWSATRRKAAGDEYGPRDRQWFRAGHSPAR